MRIMTPIEREIIERFQHLDDAAQTAYLEFVQMIDAGGEATDEEWDSWIRRRAEALRRRPLLH